MAKIINCVICDRKIIKAKDRYVKLEDFNKGKSESSCYYHLDCWKNRFKITQNKIENMTGMKMQDIKKQFENPIEGKLLEVANQN